MNVAPTVTRRGFVQATLAAGGALVLHPVHAQGASTTPGAVRPTAQLGTMIVIHPDNRVEIGCRAPEIGQGVKTALPMMVAEELDLRWADVTVKQLPLAVDFGASPPAWRFGPQGAGGSTSVSDAWDDHRQFGADARALLVAAAAQVWDSGDAAPLRTAQSWVLHPDGRRLSYGELARRAAALPPLDKAAPLKDARDFRLIGTPQRVTDARDIVTGRARYGLDTPLAGIEAAAVAVLLRCPYVDGGIVSLDDSAARQVPGVYDVRVIAGPEPGAPLGANLASAVAVVARDTWSALRGRAALKVRWSTGPHAGESSAGFDEQCRRLLAEPGQVVLDQGDFAAARAGAARLVQASYQVPFAAHAPMEPPNAFVQLWPDRALVIAPLQQPGGVPRLVMNLTGITRDKVEVRMTRAGGGFGRRLTNDAVAEAVLVAKASGRPVKLMWTRDDDLQHDFYRPAGWHAMSAALDADRRVVGWHHKLASASNTTAGPTRRPKTCGVPSSTPTIFRPIAWPTCASSGVP